MNKIFRLIVGLIFLLSALLKAIDNAAFADLMSNYGALLFGFGAPVIVFVELILGVLLVFNIHPRWLSLAASLFILVVSSVFLYGVTQKGITDCGCFGPLTWLNSKPWLTFLRNGILLALLIPSLIKPQQGASLSTSTILFMAVIGIAVMFMCGFSMHGARCLQKQHIFQAKALAESPLAEYVTVHPDSTYLVFAFSYSCPYCQNSIGNVNQYVPMGMADKVIGLAVEDSVARERFERLFETDFEIREISAMQMYRLTNTLPATFFIRHDSIVSQYTGMVISPALLLP